MFIVVNNYEYELIHHLFCTINTLLNPFHSSRIKGFNQSDVEQLENAVAVLEKLCFWDFESGEELIGSQTEDKAEPEEVPAEDEDKAELEEVPTEDEDKAEPEEEQPIFTCDCCGSCVYERIAREGVRYLD